MDVMGYNAFLDDDCENLIDQSMYALQGLPAFDLNGVKLSLLSLPFLTLIALIALISRPLLLLPTVLLALVLIEPLHPPKGEAQHLINPKHSSRGIPMEPGRNDQSAYDIADVVHLRDQQHVHHEKQTQEGHYRHPLKTEDRELEEDGSEGPRVSRVEEVSCVVVGNREAEESRTPPDDVLGVWELLNIQEDQSPRQKKPCQRCESTHVLDLYEPAQGKGYQMIPKTAIQRSIMSCPVPMKACPVMLRPLLFPSQAAEEGSRTSWRLAGRVAVWYASQMQKTSGLGKRRRQRRKGASRRRRMVPRKAMCNYRWTDSPCYCLCYIFIVRSEWNPPGQIISAGFKERFRGIGWGIIMGFGMISEGRRRDCLGQQPISSGNTAYRNTPPYHHHYPFNPPPPSLPINPHAQSIPLQFSTMAKQLKGIRGKSKALHGKFAKGSKSNASTNPDRIIKGNSSGVGNTFRSKNTIKRLKMYDMKMPKGEKLHERPTEAARVDPNRKWFGNVRTIDQKSLERLRVEMARKVEDPTKIFVKAKKIPTSLLEEPVRENKMRLLQVETYQSTFGPNSRRKRVKLALGNMEELIEEAEKKDYNPDNDTDNVRYHQDEDRPENRDKRMSAGQSQRIWGELHKVVDSSDVLVQVLDARDPMGTRSAALEEHLRKNFPHKHMVLLLNKADLVPLWVIAKWVKSLSKSYPTIAYRSSIANPFGKGSLINLFRQFDIFHRDKKNISIGFVGYPNVGKSSVINSLREKRVCKAAPVPGETKVWQYVTLTKRIYLIDCPGTVHISEGKDDVESVLKGCVRAEKIDQPTYYIPYILEKIKRKEILKKMYGVQNWEDPEDFLKQVATRKGKLRRGGEPDVDATAKIILVDWQRGDIPYFHLPEGEVDKFQPKQEQTIDNVKEEDFLKMVGGTDFKIVQEEREKDGEEGFDEE